MNIINHEIYEKRGGKKEICSESNLLHKKFLEEKEDPATAATIYLKRKVPPYPS